MSAKLKALDVLGVSSMAAAKKRATDVLTTALRCPCCQSMLGHLFDRLGSTLFLDDDPLQLARAFEPSERDESCTRVLAACIVLSGRPRVVPALAG
jgi:hypothetical protein